MVTLHLRYGVISMIALVCLLSAVQSDICLDTSSGSLQNHVSSGVSPKGGVDAGTYTKITGISNFGECVKACCDDPVCNAAFYTQESCLNIQCKTDDDCSPAIRPRMLTDAILVNVRTVAESTSDKGHSNKTGETVSNSLSTEHFDNVTCELGLFECPSNEECRASSKDNRRSKNGICQCKDGYTRQSASGEECTQITNVVKAAATAAGNGSKITHSSTSTTATTKPVTLIVKPAATAAGNSSKIIHSSTPTTTTKPPVTLKAEDIKLTVSAGDNKVLEYPKDSVKLMAYALPTAEPGESYTYHWSLLATPDGNEIGQTSGIEEARLEMTELVPGVYVLSVQVKGVNKEGSANVNVTVLAEPKINEAPVAVIKPSLLNIKEGTTGILDGADSTDDNEIKTYLWEIVSAPIFDEIKLDNNEGSMLKLSGLSHGKYSVRLTVADAAGLKNSTMAVVNVEEGADYPPTANAGDDVAINLPTNFITLFGNASTDDKGIASYEWKAKEGDSTTDIEGVHEPFLRLKHLTEGAYTFELVVTDTKGQTSSDGVHVYVKSSQNKPPVAVVDRNITTVTPGAVVLLDGSHSTDDQTITSYQWTQVSGPNKAKMDNSDRAKASIEDLIKGDYVFKLTVTDAENLHNSTNVQVQVRTLASHKPVARTSADTTVVLPIDILKVDGTESTVHGGKITYKWTKTDESPGAGSIVNGSDGAAVLLLTNIVSGSYSFTLKVTDEDGRESSDSVTIDVQPDPELKNLVEISLDTSIESFTEKHKKDLANQLVSMLRSSTVAAQTRVEINGVYTDYHSGKLTVLFVVKDYESATQFSVRNGTVVEAQLKKRLEKSSELIGFPVAQVDTVVCQNECSGHGYCDQFTKECVCEPFWMPNYALSTWNGESNCDWSILYVVVLTIASIMVFLVLIWICVCCARRCKRTRGRRKHTYKLLQDIDQMENEEKLAKKKRSNITTGSGSIFLSETDLSSEEDTLFANGNRLNGHNLDKPPDNFVKANNLKNKLRA